MATPITTVALIKQYAGITSSNQDTIIQAMINPCLMAMGAFCNRNFASQDYVAYRDGNEASGIMLSNYPITSFSSVVIDGVAIPPAVGQGNGWFFPPTGRRLILRGYRFTTGSRNVVISYKAGFGDGTGPNGTDLAPWPDDLELALWMFLMTRVKERDRLGVGSKSLAGESVSYVDATSGTSGSSQGIPSAARIILENYINVVPETGE